MSGEGPSPPPEALREVVRGLDAASGGLGVVPLASGARLPGERPIAELRRRGPRRAESDSIALAAVVEDADGVLRWRLGDEAVPRPASTLRAGRAGRRAAVVETYKLELLPPSAVTSFLARLDRKLTPSQGLRRVAPDGTLAPCEPPSGAGRAVLLVHGTFSHTESLLTDLLSTAQGRDLLARWRHDGRDVLAFDHPTLAVSPLLNALDLAELFAGHTGPVDVVAHSRGGLVTRWWREALDPRRADRTGVSVFVGAPLAGTCLAAPHRLRPTLDLLTNLATALAAASLGAPATALWTVAKGLVRVAASLSLVGGKTPLMDAVVALVPGLFAQSAVSDHPELTRLRHLEARDATSYRAIVTNFEPPPEPWWRFWPCFNRPHLANAATDLVFPGPNDLVVDTASMTDLAPERVIAGEEAVLDFGTGHRVHHCNYLAQVESVASLGEWIAPVAAGS